MRGFGDTKVAGYSIFLILALLFALTATFMPTLTTVENFFIVGAIIGIIIGFMNIVSSGETVKFLLAYLGVTAAFGLFAQIPTIGVTLQTFFGNLFVVFGFVVIVVGFRVILRIMQK